MVAISPSALIVNQTEVSVLTCAVFGVPSPNLTWTRASSPNVPLTSTSDLTITETRLGSNVTSVLTIYQTKRTDADTYTCTGNNGITNLIESPESDSTQLMVQGKSDNVD